MIRQLLATVVLAAATAGAPAAAGNVALEHVAFSSASMPLGDLQQRLARERGEEPKVINGAPIDGYLAKPEGDGPFPAVVSMHGCGGLRPWGKQAYADLFVSWGYAALLVDSFNARGIKQACTLETSFGQIVDRVRDAYGALSYLASLAFVDPRRVAVVGFSQGGTGALSVANSRSFELVENSNDLTFRAAVAFYPWCGAAGDTMAVPTLILIGALDDWHSARDCERMMAARNGRGVPVDLAVYPGAHHDFDIAPLGTGQRIFGHWMQYDAAATDDARARMRTFLARHLETQR